MMRKVFYFAFGISAWAFCGACFGQDLQGMIDAAAKTSGKKLVLKAGTYFVPEGIRLNASHSGLTIEGAPGERPEIIGGRPVKGWQREGALWKAHLPGLKYLHSLWVDGKRANLARSPNFGAFYVLGGAQSYLDENSRFSKTVPARAFCANNSDLSVLKGLTPEKLSSAYVDTFHAWFQHRYPIDAVVELPGGDTSTVYIRRRDTDHFLNVDEHARFRILNVRTALDEPGEFFFDSKTHILWYMPRKGEDISSSKAYYPTVESILSASGPSPADKIENVTLRNLKFSVGACFADPDGTWTSRHRYHDFAHFDGLVTFSNARNIAVENCVVSNCEGYGIAFVKSAWDCSVVGCELFDLGCGGIRAGFHGQKSKNFPALETDPVASGRFLIKNNIIYAYGKWRASGVGIITYDSPECVIEHNAIFDGAYSGIVAGFTLGFSETHVRANKIRFNRIFRIGNGLLSDMGGIYTLGNSPESEIVGNEIYDVYSHKYGGWGIYNDEGTQGYIVSKNFVHDTHEDSYFMHYGKGVLVENNIFVGAKVSQIGLGRLGEKYPDEYVFRRNVVLYGSPAILLRNGTEISPYNAKFDSNLYFNFGGEVMFGRKTFEQWKKTGQDKNSIVANPNVEALRPEFFKRGNPLLDKIGFEPFSTSSAGVEGAMKERFEDIMRAHKFAEVDKSAFFAKENFEVDLHFDESGLIPPSVMVRPYGAPVKVQRQKGAKVDTFIRMQDSPDYISWEPYISFNPRIFSEKCVLEFNVRLNKHTLLCVDVREPGASSGASINFDGGQIRSSGGVDKLPVGEWLAVKLILPMGQDAGQGYAYSVRSQEGKILCERKAKYSCPQIRGVGWVGFMLLGKSPDCSVDISGVRIHQ